MVINILIFIIGLVIYAGYGIAGLAYMAGAVLITYFAAFLIKKHRWVMYISVGLNVLMLLAVKLQPAFGYELIAPLGLSYFTLQIISYNVDVYKNKYEPEKSLFRYALFVTYIPHLFVGPIERYDVMRKSLFEDRKITWDGIFEGAARLMWGLFKKFVISARAAVIVNAISADPEKYSGAFAVLAMLMFSAHLYTDFSGGIDMVLGVSRMLGIKMSENFDAPYFAESFKDFWRRWHMTLGSWLRENVYIPLGGNRQGKKRQIANTIIAFLASGLWHGGRYMLWGLFNGIFVSFGDKLKTKYKFINCLGTFLLVTLLRAFYVWSDNITAFKMMGSVFTTFNYGTLFNTIGTLGLNLSDWIVFLVAFCLLMFYDYFREKLWNRFKALCPAGKTAVICAIALIVLVFGMYGIGFNVEEFIYSRF
ncbi:MAG: MBOAT family protein [Oscillospiraceae bacterium]|nr:MBOAT family protein [Oscillospiraceae bacterium]